MKKKLFCVLALAAALALTGCGGSNEADDASVVDSSYQTAQGFSSYDAVSEEYELEDESYVTEDDSEYSQKLIRTYYYSFETIEFDSSVSYINRKVSEYGGYIESSETSGSSKRYATFTIRIPENLADGFLSQVGEIGTITYQSSSSENITLEYYDLTARLESLNAQHDRLIELMEQAASLDDVVALESSLAEVEYKINSYNTTLKVYDNLVSYVTINISLSEVEQIQVVEEDNVWTQIRKGLSSNTAAVVNGLLDIFVFLVTAVPYLIVLGVIVLAVLLICKAAGRAHRKKAAKREQEEMMRRRDVQQNFRQPAGMRQEAQNVNDPAVQQKAQNMNDSAVRQEAQQKAQNTDGAKPR